MRLYTAMLITSSVVACTDVSLVAVGRLGDAIALEGEFCTSEPRAVPATTRFIFMIDNSNSMDFKDPEGHRFDAVKAVIELYRDAPNVLFAVARWDNEARFETLQFTRDPNTLSAAIQACREDESYLGNTDYVAAIDAARDFIQRDSQALEADNHVDYIVQFITDGGTPASDNLEDPAGIINTILETIDGLVAAAGDAHTARLDVLFFGSSITVPLVFVDLLPAMAQRGNGRYVQVFNSADLIAELPQLSEVDTWVREYELRAFFAGSTNTVLTRIEEISDEVEAYLDSDGDGLADAEEELLGTSAFDADTDGDGASDLVERRADGRSPLLYEETDSEPWDLIDEDHDGLLGLEEKILGLQLALPDSDNDGIPDGLEVRNGTDPRMPDNRADYDDDGISNIDEIRQHTNPRVDEGDFLRAEYGYHYGPTPVTETWQGRTCYSFTVDNVRLVETLPEDPEVQLGGLNAIDMVVLDAATDDNRNTYAACLSTAAIEFRDGMRDPNRLTLSMQPHDFCN